MLYNLYRISDNNYDWCCYTIDVSRNKAKLAVAKEFDIDYIDMRCKTLAKNVNCDRPILVYDEDCDGYDIVRSFGYEYKYE